jgi:hypothetical protein
MGGTRQALLARGDRWSRLGESNPGPTHYECVALPAELRRRVHRAGELGTIANYIQRHNAWRSPNDSRDVSTGFRRAAPHSGPGTR